MSAPDFLLHDSGDDVGVIVVKGGVRSGQELKGLNMETQETLTITSLSDIPLGHKVALKKFTEGDTVIKYGNSIGKATAAIERGEHLHVHNAKTKRW